MKHWKSLLKGATWRIVATCDTILLSYIYTKSIGNALKIGLIEIFTKIFLFYLHERIWLKFIKWGQLPNDDGNLKESHQRSLIKGISWRFFGTLDTIIISLFVTGDLSKAFAIGFTELVTKVILYYFHERLWLKYSN